MLPSTAQSSPSSDGIENYQVFGHHLRFRRSGRVRSGTAPVVLLGGALDTVESWGRYQQSLAVHSQVISAELPGCGLTGLLPWRYGVEYLSDALITWLESLKTPPVCLVALSYSTPVAYRVASERPDLVSRLCLGGTMARFSSRLRRLLKITGECARQMDREALALALPELLLNQDHQQIERGQAAHRLLRRAAMRMSATNITALACNIRRMLTHDRLDLRQPPQMPTLVFTGDNDTFANPTAGKEVADAIPAARYQLLESADHLFHIERPRATLDLLIDFLHRRLDQSLTTDRYPYRRFSSVA